MEVKFAKSFGESLDKLISSERWYNKAFDAIRYGIPRFLKNVWRFRKALWNHYWWDHHGTLMFLDIGLTHMADKLEKDGLEVDESRLKKVAAMRRAVQLIKNYNEDNYIEQAEAELGALVLHDWNFVPVEGKDDLFQLEDRDTPEEKAHNRKVFDRARKIGEAEWKELWKIFSGQDMNEYRSLIHNVKTNEEREKEQDNYYKWFDGSDMRGWWD